MLLPYQNLRMNHWNPGASQPLVLPINVVCNTDDSVLHDQIRANSALKREWVNVVPEHDGIALLCGSGPSIRQDLNTIRDMQRAGAKVFALNNCANLLNSVGITPDYQVILDARKETADLIGYAKEHLFASQVHPSLFEKVPSAKLWQLDVGPETDNLLPENYPAHALIGGAASVGNTATCLVYAMGYRTLHCFGYDSSHKDGLSHAVHQRINDGDPCAYVDFNGKTYLCSLTMKMQAEKFQQTASDLKVLGCTIHVHGEGLLPDMYHAPKEVLGEADKYSQVWMHPDYREISPGEHSVPVFLEWAKPESGATVVDFGCGTGRASIRLHDLGFGVRLVDITTNSRDKEAMGFSFTQADLSLPMHVRGDYGYCADVMEHLPPEQVKSAIYNIMQCASAVFFQISRVHDNFGTVDHPLHLTVRPHAWWVSVFTSMGFKVSEARENRDHSQFLIRK